MRVVGYQHDVVVARASRVQKRGDAPPRGRGVPRDVAVSNAVFGLARLRW